MDLIYDGGFGEACWFFCRTLRNVRWKMGIARTTTNTPGIICVDKIISCGLVQK